MKIIRFFQFLLLIFLLLVLNCSKDSEKTKLKPVLTTTAVSSITTNSASSGGNITKDGGATVTTRGVCWNTSGNPTTANSKTSNGSGTGSFSSSITGLSSSTTYYVRAYATNSEGTAYGNQVSFTTLAPANVIPTLTTTAVSSITTNSASSGGNITSDGGATVTARGVCWNTTGNPTTANSKTTDGSGTGSFSSSITGLSANTTYYVRAYATNSAGTAYGNQVPFTTSSPAIVVPILTTTAVSSITTNSASSGGNITSDGGATVTARGVCWNTSGNPTTANSKTTDGSGTGSFSSSITGLSASTTYYVHAYATNSAGTAYGDQLSFTTSAAATVPNAPSNLTANATNPSTVHLSWNDNSNNETGFEIKRFYEPLSAYLTVTTVGANVTSYTHSGLNETWQAYIVCAYNAAGSSSFSNSAAAPAKIRIINDLYSSTPTSGNDWYKLNKIVRIRIGPTSSAVENDANNTYERLCPYDNLSESMFLTYADWIDPSYQSTSKYEDFPVSTYGYGSTYYVYAQCGWWEYVVISPPYYWTKRVSQVLCTNGTCCCYKWAWVQIINHESGYFVLKASEMGLPWGSWNGTVKGTNEGTVFDAKAPRLKY